MSLSTRGNDYTPIFRLLARMSQYFSDWDDSLFGARTRRCSIAYRLLLSSPAEVLVSGFVMMRVPVILLLQRNVPYSWNFLQYWITVLLFQHVALAFGHVLIQCFHFDLSPLTIRARDVY